MHKWGVAISKLRGFMGFIDEPFDEEKVADYHAILALFEEASDYDLSHFKIPPEKMKPKVISSRRASYSGAPGHVRYSDNKNCDAGYFRAQMSGLANQVTLISGAIAPTPKPKSTDSQKPPSVSNTFNYHGSNVVYDSPHSSIAQNIGLESEQLRKIITELKQFSATPNLSADNRTQINIDIGTIELQTSSAHPNPSIIKASLESAKAIAENAAGTVLGAGMVFAIKNYLGIP